MYLLSLVLCSGNQRRRSETIEDFEVENNAIEDQLWQCDTDDRGARCVENVRCRTALTYHSSAKGALIGKAT
jgi:hypothetical protein